MKYKSKYKKRKKYSTGGMYQPNVITPGLNPGSTTNIVYNESDPQLQQDREDRLESKVDTLQSRTNAFVADYEKQLATNKAELEAKNAEFQAKTKAAENIVGQGTKAITSQLTKSAAQKAGQQVTGQVSRGAMRSFGRGLKAAAKGNQAKAARLAKRSASRAVQGKAATAGKAASKAGGLLSTGSLMSIGGQAVSALSNDNDATKWNAGEVTGDIASAAGTGMMLGSVIPGVGNVVGGIVGGLYGLGKGLLGRRKARKMKAAQESEQANALAKHNREIREAYTPQAAVARAGEIQQKTTSGYDTGVNISAKYGGLKKYI